jgi:hypothetical protein
MAINTCSFVYYECAGGDAFRLKKPAIFPKKTLVKFFTMRQLFRAFNGNVGIDGNCVAENKQQIGS